MRHPPSSVVAFATALALTACVRASADDVLLQQTLVITLAGQEVGTLEALDKRTAAGITMSRIAKLQVRRGEVVNDMKTETLVKLTRDLRPISYRYQRTDAAGTLLTEGTLKNDVLQLTTTQNGAIVKTNKAVPPHTTFGFAVEHEMRSQLIDGKQLERSIIIEELGAQVQMTGSIKKQGAGYTLQTTFMNLTSDEEVDAAGRTLVSRTPGMGVVAYPIGRAPMDVLKGQADLMAVSTWQVQSVHPPVARVLYRLSTLDARNFAIPEDERQTIKERTDQWVTIEVKEGDTFTGALGLKRKAELLAATPYEAIDDPRLKNAAAAAAKGATDKLDEIGKLVDFVHAHVATKGLDRGYAPAIATLESRQGDCTEHSVLLSALLRTRGFPTRLVDGVVVSGTNAGYHEWVEVYVEGRGFVPADPTFGVFPAGPERLKLAVGTTSPDEFLGLSLAASRLLRAGVKLEVLEVSR